MRPVWRSEDGVAGGSSRSYSPGVAEVTELLASRPPVRVLDLGAANDRNVSFFTHKAKSVYVEDVLADHVRRGSDWPLAAPPELSAPQAPGGGYGLVLCWDVFEYLSPDAVKGLAGELRSLCAEGAVLFLLRGRTRRISARPGRYKLLADDTLGYDVGGEGAAGPAPVSTRAFGRLMCGFERRRTYRLRNGTDEEIFTAAPWN